MMLEGLIAGGGFYLIWKGGKRVYYKLRVKSLEKDLKAVNKAILYINAWKRKVQSDIEKEKERAKQREIERYQAKLLEEHHRQVKKVFFMDLKKRSKDETDDIVTPYGYVSLNDVEEMRNEHPDMDIWVGGFSSMENTLNYGVATSVGTQVESLYRTKLQANHPTGQIIRMK